MTVQNALRELREEGLIVSRQGSGVFVRERTERPVGLRPHIERAFDAQHVSIDFSGFFGFYPVREHIITLGGTPRAIYDIMGKDTILFHHSITDDDTSTGSQYLDQARTWYDSVWNTIATEFTR